MTLCIQAWGLTLRLPVSVRLAIRKAVLAMDAVQPKLLMKKSTIEPNGLHYPDETGVWKDGSKWVTPSDCLFAGCVPNMPCKVEAYEKFCAEKYNPTLDLDLDY